MTTSPPPTFSSLKPRLPRFLQDASGARAAVAMPAFVQGGATPGGPVWPAAMPPQAGLAELLQAQAAAIARLSELMAEVLTRLRNAPAPAAAQVVATPSSPAVLAQPCARVHRGCHQSPSAPRPFPVPQGRCPDGAAPPSRCARRRFGF